MLRSIQEIKPKYVIAENVFGIVNIDGGLVFNQVCVDLETEGYEVQPFIIGAASKNAPHRRYRCWFVGISTNSNGIRLEGIKSKTQREHSIDGNTWDIFPTQSPVCSGDDGIPNELDGIAFSKWRAESIKGYGNAIVPQIAYQLFEIILELNENN
jgi:DNA (cytosine-5)-methyltransferase 1